MSEIRTEWLMIDPPRLDYAQWSISRRLKKLLGVLIGIPLETAIGAAAIAILVITAYWIQRHRSL